ncbi:MAG: WYL domain-containing protein [Burkholderiaceae bacterium]|nr:WYL domain-containing protein [Burkholderiaceae bacterium]
MRPADRLFRLVQLIRGRRLSTAAFLALRLEVSLRTVYRDLSDNTSQRVVRPLGCFFWGKVWTLAAWCETRQDFRSFRLDRMARLTVVDTVFPLETGKALADFLRKVGATGI